MREAPARHADTPLGGGAAGAAVGLRPQTPEQPEARPLLRAASLWEIAIKHGLGRADFRADPRQLRRGLLDNGYSEIPITSEHAVTLDLLPALHKDPFDRILLAQALVEGVTLVTVDAELAKYPGPIRKL